MLPSIDLAFDRVDGANPSQAIAFLHGILGRGLNLRMIARRFVEVRPDWTAWLIDLRGHGRSPKGTPEPSIEAAGRDVVNLAAPAELPLGAIVGHSFGGKVALEVARLDTVKSLANVVTIDSAPGSKEGVARDESPFDVINVLESLPREFVSKTDFIRAIVAAGKTRTLAEWLAGSAERESDHVHFSLDLNEIRTLTLDYFARDLWPVVKHPPGEVKVHLIIADRSDSYSPADRDRALRIAASNTQVTADILPRRPLAARGQCRCCLRQIARLHQGRIAFQAAFEVVVAFPILIAMRNIYAQFLMSLDRPAVRGNHTGFPI